MLSGFESSNEFNGSGNDTRTRKLTSLPRSLPKRFPHSPQNFHLRFRTLPIPKQMHHTRQPPLLLDRLIALHARTPAWNRTRWPALFDEHADELEDPCNVFGGGDLVAGLEDCVGDCGGHGAAGCVGLGVEEGEVVGEGEDGEEVCVGGDGG